MQNITITKDLVKFFEKYNLQITVFDNNYNIIMKYPKEAKSKSLNSHMKNVCFCIVHNNHLYRISNPRSVMNMKQTDDNDKEIKVYDTFALHKETTDTTKFTCFAKHPEQIQEMLCSHFEKEIASPTLIVQYNNDMKELLTYMLNEWNFEPRIISSDGTILDIVFYVNQQDCEFNIIIKGPELLGLTLGVLPVMKVTEYTTSVSNTIPNCS